MYMYIYMNIYIYTQIIYTYMHIGIWYMHHICIYIGFLYFYWIFSLFAFQMSFPFHVSPLGGPYAISSHTASMRVLPHPSTHSHLPALAFPYTGASNPHRPKRHSSCWHPTSPSSPTYATGPMSFCMCSIWLVVWTWEFVWLTLLLLKWDCKCPQLLQSLL